MARAICAQVRRSDLVHLVKGKFSISGATSHRGARKLFVYLDETGLTATAVRFREAMGYQGWLAEVRRKDHTNTVSAV